MKQHKNKLVTGRSALGAIIKATRDDFVQYLEEHTSEVSTNDGIYIYRRDWVVTLNHISQLYGNGQHSLSM